MWTLPQFSQSKSFVTKTNNMEKQKQTRRKRIFMDDLFMGLGIGLTFSNLKIGLLIIALVVFADLLNMREASK